MEKYVEILKEILEKEVHMESENYLDSYIQIAKGYKINEFIKDESKVNELTDKFIQEYQFQKYLCCDDILQRIKLEKLIYEIRIKFINKDENILYLLPLIIHIDCRCIILKKMISLYNLNDICTKEIEEKLNRYIINIEPKEGLSDFDTNIILYNNYNYGVNNIDFEKIYEFIDALEYGGRYCNNYFVDICGMIFFKIAKDEFIDMINRKNEIITIKHLTNLLDDKDKISLAYKSNNILVKFEILKQFLYFNSKVISGEFIKELSEVIFTLTDNLEVWEKFIKYYFKFPIRSPNFFKSLSLILCKLNKEKLDIVCDNLILDKYSNMEKIKIIDSCFTHKNLVNPILNDNIKKIYIKWIGYIKNYKDFTNEIILTDVINIVIFHVCNYMPISEFDEECGNCINLIKEINNVWYRDKSERITSLHKQLTILLVLGYRKNIDQRREIYKELKENIFINENIIKIFNINWIDRA